jgi:hypothetical protein
VWTLTKLQPSTVSDANRLTSSAFDFIVFAPDILRAEMRVLG